VQIHYALFNYDRYDLLGMAHFFDTTTPEFIQQVESNVRNALEEDIGAGDLTASLVPSDQHANAKVITRDAAVICGQPWAQEVVRQAAPHSQLDWHVGEGAHCTAGQTIFTLKGPARELLSVERTILNFVQMMSAVATKTAIFTQAVQGTRAQIVDTRKTLPGLRAAQKYAVAAGGGTNHRMGLHDAILIKENHIAAAGGIAAVMRVALASVANTKATRVKFIEIEVENLDQLQEALNCGAKMVLLDNMDIPTMQEAVRINSDRAVLEISGGVDLDTVRALALTGVDRISVGALTKDVKAVDLSMRIEH
jgi:nicotinate-nucleotide pyrophosphorylase (carboxylating)